jgi:hypothetical protein
MARAFAGPLRTPQASNTSPSGIPQGTMGGMAMGRPGRPQFNLGDEMYLWVLVILEVFATAMLRQKFRRYHGG